MAAPAAGGGEFAVLDQLVVRALVSVRVARAAHDRAPTPANLALRDQAEQNLDALLDARSGAARRRRAEAVPAAGSPTAHPLPA
jgi:hypothetical protein